MFTRPFVQMFDLGPRKSVLSEPCLPAVGGEVTRWATWWAYGLSVAERARGAGCWRFARRLLWRVAGRRGWEVVGSRGGTGVTAGLGARLGLIVGTLVGPGADGAGWSTLCSGTGVGMLGTFCSRAGSEGLSGGGAGVARLRILAIWVYALRVAEP